MLKKRVITGLWAFALVIGAIWFDRPIPWFTVLIAAWGALAVLEVYQLTGVSRFPVLVVFGLVWSLAYTVSPHLDMAVVVPALRDQSRIITGGQPAIAHRPSSNGLPGLRSGDQQGDGL